MRFAFLTCEYAALGLPEGGLGNYLTRMAGALVEAGHEVHVFFSAIARAEWRTKSLETTIDGVHVTVVPNAAEGDVRLRAIEALLPRRVLGAAYATAKAFQSAHADQGFDAVQVPTLMPAALLLDDRCPLILRASAYSTWVREVDEIEIAAEDFLVEEWERQSLLETPHLYAPSAYLAKRLRDEFGFDCAVVRPPLPAATQALDDRWAEGVREAEETTLVWLGSVARRKGSREAARAFEKAVAQVPSLRLHVCGGDQGGLTDFAALPEAVRARIAFHGPQPAVRAQALLRRAVALVAPSRIENLSNSVIEAHAWGIPAIVCDETSSEELCPAELRSVLPVVGDIDSLASAMATASNLPSRGLANHVGRLLNAAEARAALVAVAERASREPRVRERDVDSALAALLRHAAEVLAVVKPRRSEFERAWEVVRELGALDYDQLWIWGAGDTNRRAVQTLVDSGIAVTGVVDADPARLGEHWRSWRIVAPCFPDAAGICVTTLSDANLLSVTRSVQEVNAQRSNPLLFVVGVASGRASDLPSGAARSEDSNRPGSWARNEM
jgi:glycosyltransferase involved in cell wall biosynthesis